MILFHFASVVKPAAFAAGLPDPTTVPAVEPAIVKPATAAEYAVHLADTTFSRVEMTLSRRFNLTLPEARELIAMGEEAVKDAEFGRLDAWDDANRS